jgi:sugar lactone lactonase YvrE
MTTIKPYLTLFFLSVVAASFISCKKNNGDSPASTDIEISKILPESAGNGDTVTIVGKNFLQNGINPTVAINNKPVSIIKQDKDTLKMIVPKLLGSGAVVVTRNGKTYTGPQFTYKYKATVTTIAGSGAVGINDGAGRLASFNCPWGLTLDDNGGLYVADCYNRLIRKVKLADNSVSTIHIPTYVDGGNFYSPYNITFNHNDKALYVTDFNNNLMRAGTDGTLKVIYTGTMPTTGIAVGPDGYLYMSNNTKGTIMKLNTDGKDTVNFSSGIRTPNNIIFDKQNTMYVSGYDIPSESAAIFKVDNTGKPTVVVKDKSFHGWEIAVDAQGNFYEADHVSNVIKIIEKSGNIVIIAGNGMATDVDGVGLKASFDGPQGMVIDKDGNLYVATYNYDKKTGNKIRKIVIE